MNRTDKIARAKRAYQHASLDSPMTHASVMAALGLMIQVVDDMDKHLDTHSRLIAELRQYIGPENTEFDA